MKLIPPSAQAIRCIIVLSVTVAVAPVPADDNEPVLIPRIDGPWWQVAGDPDLGAATSPDQQPVDFGVWQAADGTWQLWSCIRKTNCGGNTRLFHGWEGRRLTDDNWKPLGIVMRADPQLGESPGGLQAPHVIRHDGTYYMFYGDWCHILFNTQRYGSRQHTPVFRSADPLTFGINDNRFEVTTIPVAAPEIILYEGQYYIASLMPSLKGIHIARLQWEPKGG